MAEKLQFAKYHGAGNDFVVVDDWDGRWALDLDSARVRAICHRHFGVGADGMMLMQADEEVDYKMVYFNADGHLSTLCGNGSRCLAHFAFERGRIGRVGAFRAVDGVHRLSLQSDSAIELEMRPVVEMSRDGDDWVLDTGSPHLVRFVKNVREIAVDNLGRKIRQAPHYNKEGINVNFAEIYRDGLFVRTYERGVENETLSCGTGVTAAALSYAAMENLDAGTIPLYTRGGKLWVRFAKKDTAFEDVWLIGPAQRVFDGELQLNDLTFPV